MNNNYTATEFAQAIDPEKVRQSGRGYMVRCPAHNDNNPSLKIDDKDGKVLFHCFAGCTQDEVLDELKARNLWQSGRQGEWEAECSDEMDLYAEVLRKLKGGTQAEIEKAAIDYFNDEPIETASPIVSVAEFNAIDFPPDNPIIGPISKGTINLFGGLSGVGKTLFAHDLAAGASAAGSVAHWRCLTPAKTVIIDGEMGGYKMQQRMAAVSRPKRYDLITSAMMLLSEQPRLNLFHQRKEWLRWLEPYDMVIMDNIYTLFPTTNELTANSGEYWEAIAGFLFELKALGKAVVLMDHLNDSGSRLSGTTNKRWGADLVGILWRDPKEPQPRTAQFVMKFGYECGGKVRDEFVPHLHQDSEWSFIGGGFDSR